ncbi:MAG: PilW family protein [Acidimicrobiia bacterium]
MRLHDDDGITLVELAISSFILLIISAIMLTALMMAVRTNKIVVEDTETLTTARIARARMELEIRQADEVLSSSTSSSIVLWLDDNNDDVVDTGEQISWAFVDQDGLAGGKADLIRRSDDPAVGNRPNGIHYRSPLGATHTPFAYDVLPPGTQQVTITLIVEPESDFDGGSPVTLTSTVTPRNVS